MAKVKKSWKQESRGDWQTTLEETETLSPERIQTGAILRIADAVELMSKNYLQMERDLKWWKERAERFERTITQMENEARTLRGVITRHRNERDRLREQLISTNS